MKSNLTALFMAAVLSSYMPALVFAAEGPKPDNPKKQTVLDKYIKSVDAYGKWKAAPDKVQILDVRTSEEYVFVGHASMARNIPFRLWTGEWNPEENKYIFKVNPDFDTRVRKHYKSDDVILVMCRSGDRSAEAVNAMAKLGFTNAYSVVDSFEGDLVTDPDSHYDGKRLKNGWKNSGAPWTYDLDPKLIYQVNKAAAGK